MRAVAVAADGHHGLRLLAEETAENFLKTKQDVWTNWVPAEVAEKVLAAIG